MDNPVRVLVFIKKTIRRKGLSHILHAMPTIVVVGETAEGLETLRMARESKPQVILLDQEQFESAGPDFMQRVWQDNPQMGLLILANYGQEEQVRLDHQPGSLRYAQKDLSPQMLARLVQEIAQNGASRAAKSPSHPNG